MDRKLAATAAVSTVVVVCALGTAIAAPSPGAYKRTVTSAQLQAAGSAAPYGTWTLKITSRGFSLAAKGQGLVPERAAWTGSRVTVSDTPGAISIFCGASVKGAYRWARAGAKLTLKLIADGCKDRAGVLAGVWKTTA